VWWAWFIFILKYRKEKNTDDILETKKQGEPIFAATKGGKCFQPKKNLRELQLELEGFKLWSRLRAKNRPDTLAAVPEVFMALYNRTALGSLGYGSSKYDFTISWPSSPSKWIPSNIRLKFY
jgi:hypothetical protein